MGDLQKDENWNKVIDQKFTSEIEIKIQIKGEWAGNRFKKSYLKSCFIVKFLEWPPFENFLIIRMSQ